MSEQLLPCPWCGGTAQHNNSDTSAHEWYECSVCGAKAIGVNQNDYYSQGKPTPESLWNRRAPDPCAIEKCVEVVRDSAYSDEAMGLSCSCEKDGFDQGFCAAIRIASKALQALLEEGVKKDE